MEKKKKRRGDRRDGTWLRNIDAMHAFMPYLYPNRADNEAFIQESIELENIEKYLAEKNAKLADGEEEYKLFHVLLAALVKTITLRPKMNRFVKGGRMYQRNTLSLAFVVKKKFSDNGAEALAFMEFDGETTIDDVHRKISAEINECRSEKIDNSTAGMDAFTKMPRWLLRIVMWVLHRLDYYGKVPYSLIKTDPNHATCFITNLGSIGLKAGYHHLCNWGTNSLFIVLGQKKKSPIYDDDGNMSMKDTMPIGITLDERIADGYYYSKTVKLLKYLLANPELLETAAKEEVDYERS
ncbi:MAG: 2-oxo acid dehydrogenase subunit E2 [Firmicutes bacterium]|nr:2-oxo acid dehydrogenase subunit E2 [Bacillota bacterium]